MRIHSGKLREMTVGKVGLYSKTPIQKMSAPGGKVAAAPIFWTERPLCTTVKRKHRI